MMINSKPMTVDAVMEVLGYSRSYIYKLLRCGQLEYCDALRPTQVTSKSVLSHIGRRFPFLMDNCFTSIHYHVSQQ